MEVRYITKSQFPKKPMWSAIARQAIKNILGSKGKINGVEIILNRNENPDSLRGAFRKILIKEFNKVPKVSVKKHNLGSTVYLMIQE